MLLFPLEHSWWGNVQFVNYSWQCTCRMQQEKCSSYRGIKLQQRASYFWRGQEDAVRDQETQSGVCFLRYSIKVGNRIWLQVHSFLWAKHPKRVYLSSLRLGPLTKLLRKKKSICIHFLSCFSFVLKASWFCESWGGLFLSLKAVLTFVVLSAGTLL